MIDAFSLFGVPRQPWLDPEALKAAFLSLSVTAHPDRFHNLAEPEREEASQRFGQLNTAYNCLRETKTRLQHLLQLERGTKPRDVQSFPDDLMSLFAEVSNLCRRVDGFLAEKERATSPLLKVRFVEQGMAWTDALGTLLKQIEARRGAVDAELKTMNRQWEVAPSVGSPERQQALPLARLEELYRDTSYLTRWTGQIQERNVQLAF